MKRNSLKRYILPAFVLVVFEIVAITLWLTKNNIFYLFNFSYIGISITLGLVLFAQNYKHARRVVQLLVGLYMLIYLGLICNENMQIEGFWYYLFTGVFEAATIHYAVAKIFGPLIFGRGWCGYACWTAMVLDFLPYKTPDHKRRKIGWIRYIVFLVALVFVAALFMPHTKMLYGTPIDPKETQVLNTSVEDTKASSMRNALIVAYDANKAVNYSDCYALTENSLFYEADKDCTNFVSQCVWAGYGGWVNGDETANAQNIAAHYRMYHHNNSDWYTTSWFAHKNGGSSPWESATSHGNFALGNTGSGLGPFGLGSTTAVLYSNYDASSIQRGDVVQLGRSANDIRHSVIVRTAGSSFENIFVNSHNSKHYNYPLSKYFETYSYIRVIHYRPAFFAN